MTNENTLTKEKIIELIKKIYDIDIYQVLKINRGSANIYSLNNNKYILKEFQEKYKQEDIDKEVHIINHLKKDGIKVPDYIKTKKNNYSFIYKERVIVLEKYIDGYTKKSNTGSYKQILESAEYLGKIINSLQNLDIELSNINLSNWYSKEQVIKGIKKHKELLKNSCINNNPKILKDIEDKISMLEYIKDKYSFDGIDKLTIMNTHGDYSVLQFIYKNEKVNAIIDFVSASKNIVVWELIRSYSYIDPASQNGKINIKNLINYTKTLTNYVKLNTYDLKLMPYIYLVQLLTSTYGYKEYATNGNIELLNFAHFRTNLCRFLFKESNNISTSLLREIPHND